MLDFLKFWKKKKYNINGIEIIFKDKSSLLSLIKKPYLGLLIEVILRFFESGNPSKYFSSIEVNLSNQFKTSFNPEKWFDEAIYHVFRINNNLEFPSTFASVNTEKGRVESHVSITFNIDVILYWVLAKAFKSVKDTHYKYEEESITAATYGDIEKYEEVMEKFGGLLAFDSDIWEASKRNPSLRRILVQGGITFLPEIFKNKVFRNELIETLMHELTHIVHAQVSDYFEMRNRHYQKYDDFKKSLLLSFTSFRKKKLKIAIIHLRQGLDLFCWNLVSEGVARYIQNRPPTNNLDYWIKTYKDAKTAVSSLQFFEEELIRLFQEREASNLKMKKLIERADFISSQLKSSSYPIGFHIIYTIYFFGKKVDIKTLKRREAIELYESLCVRLGNQPVISYSSGSGIIDIRRLIKKVIEQYKKVK